MGRVNLVFLELLLAHRDLCAGTGFQQEKSRKVKYERVYSKMSTVKLII